MTGGLISACCACCTFLLGREQGRSLHAAGGAGSARSARRPLVSPPHSARSPPPPRAGRPWGWLSRLAGQLKVQSPWRLLLNLAALAVLMRFWPLPGSRHPLGVSEPITVQARAALSLSRAFCAASGAAYNCQQMRKGSARYMPACSPGASGKRVKPIIWALICREHTRPLHCVSKRGTCFPHLLYHPPVPQVAFSEFVKYVRKADVGRVVIDGNSFSFTLKPHSALLRELPGGAGGAGRGGAGGAGGAGGQHACSRL